MTPLGDLHILMFLETRNLSVISESDVIHYTERLVRRLYKFDLNESELLTDNSLSSNLSTGDSNQLEAELNSFLKQTPMKQCESSNDLQKLLKAELKSFKQTGQRGKFLQFTYDQARQIKVSSVDVERVFSSLGLIITKFRTRLADSTIDSYLFLKHYFRRAANYVKDFAGLNLDFKMAINFLFFWDKNFLFCVLGFGLVRSSPIRTGPKSGILKNGPDWDH